MNNEEQLNILEQRVSELEEMLSSKESETEEMVQRFTELERIVREHNHTELDGTRKIESYIPQIAEAGDIVDLGEGAIFSYKLSDGSEGMFMAAGQIGSVDPIGTRSEDYASSLIGIQQSKATGTNFIVAYGQPQLIQPRPNLSTTAGGSTISAGDLDLRDGELANAQINIYNSSGTFVESKEIEDNSTSSITIKETWLNSTSNCSYVVIRPAFVGANEARMNAAYFKGFDVSASGDRSVNLVTGMGHGGGGAIGLYFGTGVPTLAANDGSLFLRTDGAAGSTFYVREGGTWVAK